MNYRLFQGLEALFAGAVYRHRASNQGDLLARYFYEDLHALPLATPFHARVAAQGAVANTTNVVPGRPGRRGDGTFGERLLTFPAVRDPGFQVAAGLTADIQIGVEVKILATAMIKQIDRVMGDLEKQARRFRASSPGAIAVGIVAVNHAVTYESYEGERTFAKTGSQAPAVEAPKAIAQLAAVRPHFDELLYPPLRGSQLRSASVSPAPAARDDEPVRRCAPADARALREPLPLMLGTAGASPTPFRRRGGGCWTGRGRRRIFRAAPGGPPLAGCPGGASGL